MYRTWPASVGAHYPYQNSFASVVGAPSSRGVPDFWGNSMFGSTIGSLAGVAVGGYVGLNAAIKPPVTGDVRWYIVLTAPLGIAVGFVVGSLVGSYIPLDTLLKA